MATASAVSSEDPKSALKPTKLKVISPTTGISVTVADTDLLKPVTTSSSRRASAARRESKSIANSAVPEPATPVQEPDDNEEEEEHIRAMVSSSGAVTSHKKGKEGVAKGDSKLGVAFARAAENSVGPVLEGDPDIVFIEDGGKFRHLKKLRAGDETDEAEESHSFDEQLHRLCVGINTSSAHILQTAHGIYAGLCLLSISLFPPTVPLITPYASAYANVEKFVAFYSPVSNPVSRLFCVLGTAAVLAAMDGGIEESQGRDGVTRVGRWWKSGRRMSGVGAVRWWRRRSGRAKRMAAFLAVICAAVSYICSVVMIPVDDRLFESQNGPFGGIYGRAGWYLNATTVSVDNGTAFDTTMTTRYNTSLLNVTFEDFYPLAGGDISYWQDLNSARGVFGVAGWVFCCVSRMMMSKRKGKRAMGFTQVTRKHDNSKQKVVMPFDV
ncbi:hypothetical protein HDU98_005473 [Podochytrium sp. JEL0797]|nr:hypothetical protein HDU98_005473 [Podochytrium sp. JEL0797]